MAYGLRSSPRIAILHARGIAVSLSDDRKNKDRVLRISRLTYHPGAPSFRVQDDIAIFIHRCVPAGRNDYGRVELFEHQRTAARTAQEAAAR
jgi:hypothetical protein